jgi:hypothetical protein
VHEHIARAMYYFSVHLLFASVVASAAWALTSILRASATTKYWIWVAAAFNFVLPSGALIDKLWAPHVTWATPLAVIGDPVWDMTQGRSAVILGVIWMTGAFSMLMRLISRIRKERREAKVQDDLNGRADTSDFVTDGIPVNWRQSSESRCSGSPFPSYPASHRHRSAAQSTRIPRCPDSRTGPCKTA